MRKTNLRSPSCVICGAVCGERPQGVRSDALLAAGDQLAKRLEHIMEFCGTLSTKARCDIGRKLERWDEAKAANRVFKEISTTN